MSLELLARIVLSSSICQVALHLLSPILFCQCGCLSFCSLRVISLPRQMRPHVDPSCACLNWSSFPLFHSLCLGGSFFVCIHCCFSRQGSVNNRSDSFSTFVVVWFDSSSMRCQRWTPRTTSSVTVKRRCPQTTRRLVLAQPLDFFPPQCWAMEIPLLLCQL